ncbi:hypothetical protein CA85_23940 [Allorhodopirellula solitaria]|uniref:Glycosyltransferase RgtA/B/C/D-like domain-containing protein n=2 Tax=Allorhodopirellula solitaria TaxID=2527987 RepID=A0A5C5XZ32_9BACT|nr:hypothetical protein CA85_23940 [Allorhodopirellula solitaria]
MARHTRLPAYPSLLQAVQAVSPSEAAGLQAVVLIQILLHAVAVAMLMTELRNWGVPRPTAIAAAATVAIGCPFWDNVSTIATDCLAMSVGVMIAVAVMRGWRKGFSRWLNLGIGMAVVLAIGLRPASLFLIPWVIAMLLFRPRDRAPVSWRGRGQDVVVFGSLPLIILLGWCAFRYHVAGDFSLLPFGHQNMAAVTTQLLDNEELERLLGRVGEIASEIGERRVVVSQSGARSLADAGSLPRDGLDLRVTSDPSLRADSYMTLENRWDAMTYLVVIPAAAQVAGDDPIAQHRLLSRLDHEIVEAYPLRYARWWLLAVRRGIWGSFANILMHPIFLPVIVFAAAAAVVWSVRRRADFASPAESLPVAGARGLEPACRAMTLIAISFAGFGIAFIALTSPTIGRFTDPTFVFVPCLAVLVVASGLDNRPSISVRTR